MKRATYYKQTVQPYDLISIHALVKRATFFDVTFNASYVISIHALVKRATFNLLVLTLYILYFNPRPREEGDQR